MASLPIYSFNIHDLEKDFTTVMRQTIDFIVNNKISLEELENVDDFAVMLRPPSFWDRLLKQAGKEDICISIVRRQNCYPGSDNESQEKEPTNTQNG